MSRLSGSANAYVSLYWDANDGIGEYADLTIAHFDAVEDEWEVITAELTGTNSSGSMTSSSPVTSFSPFTKGSTSAGGLLPVELISFTGSCNGNEVNLSWSTASELNNDYFIVERAEDQGRFEVIDEVEGAGTTTLTNDYQWSEYVANSSTHYYRLSQVDFDGGYEVFEVIAIQCEDRGSYDNYVYVNKGAVYVQSRQGMVKNIPVLNLINSTGTRIKVVEDYTFGEPIYLKELSAGLYHIQFESSRGIESHSFIWDK